MTSSTHHCSDGAAPTELRPDTAHLTLMRHLRAAIALLRVMAADWCNCGCCRVGQLALVELVAAAGAAVSLTDREL